MAHRAPDKRESTLLEKCALQVRLPLHIAIVALARYVIIDSKHMDDARIMAITGGTLILAFAVLAINFTHSHFPPNDDDRISESAEAHTK